MAHVLLWRRCGNAGSDGAPAGRPPLCRGYELGKVTDFTGALGLPPGLPSQRQNFSLGHPRHIWDGRNIKTETFHEDLSGSPSKIRYEDGSDSTYDRIDSSGSDGLDEDRMHNTYPHWLFKKKDELGQLTIYRRDERRRIKRIEYHDGSSEEYTYNDWNQVETHKLPSGAVQHYQYNALHQLVLEYNSANEERKEYSYDGLGRVERMRDPQAILDGAPYTERMEYNGRHQVLKIHYRSTGGSSDPTVTYEYDRYGNRTVTIDELGHRKDFAFDSYRRCTSSIEQIGPAGTGCNGVQTRRWDWIYDRVIEGDTQPTRPVSAHTSKEWRIQIEPEFNNLQHRRATSRTFDANNRMLSEQTGLIQLPNRPLGHLEPPGADAETHRVSYDRNGQKETSTDPLGRVTTYGYNDRNRLERTTEPKPRPDQPNPVTRLEYDVAGNKKKITFPDGKTQRWENHDPFGQARQFFDENNNPTDLIYQWGPMKKLYRVTTHRGKDGGGMEDQPTTFIYDSMGRPTQTQFPDGTTEVTTYELGQLKSFKTRRGQKKIVDLYDARGREEHHYWLKPDLSIDGSTPAVSRLWDDASRMKKIWNSFSIIDYTYDDVGQVRTEGTTVTGTGGPNEVRYCRYPNGDVSQITYPNGSAVVSRNYTARGQLESVGWGSGATSYAYLKDGRVNYQARTNHVETRFEYDGRGMISSVRHKNTDSNHDLAYREYWRNDRDRIVAWKRGTDQYYNGMEDGRGNRYDYDPEGQLTRASYRALTPEGTPSQAMRTDSFVYDQLGNRKGNNHVANRGAWMNIARRDNGLNQYHSWENDHPAPHPQHWGSGIYYDDNFNADWHYPGNGVMMAEGYIVASYNALNQPVAMWTSTYGSDYLWFGHDPLGRCVKRWKGPATAGTAGYTPATYYYYDGWNLAQEGPSASTADRTYVHGGGVDEIVASQVSGVWYNHHYDAQGNCILLSNVGGGLQEQYDYDAFGYPYLYTASGYKLGPVNLHTRFLFTGREWFNDLKVYDYRARMYQPELGRFLQPDPLQFAAGDYNLYRYCHNDPVNKSDPTGLADDTWERQMWLQGGSKLSSAENLERKRLYANGYVTVAQISFAKPAGQSAPTVNDFAGFYNAAKPTFDPIYGKVLKEKTEFFSRIDKNDKTGDRIVGRVTRGLGVGDYDDNVAKGRAERSEINNEGLARGYRVEGYVLGHRYYDPMYMYNDMKRAAQHKWHAIYLTPPMTRARFVPVGMQIIPYDYTRPEPILNSH